MYYIIGRKMLLNIISNSGKYKIFLHRIIATRFKFTLMNKSKTDFPGKSRNKRTVLTYLLHLSRFYSVSHYIFFVFLFHPMKNSKKKTNKKTNYNILFLKFYVLNFMHVIRSYLKEFIFYIIFFCS